MESLDAQMAVGMVGWVVAFLFGKHLRAGFAAWRTRVAPRLARQER